MANSILPHTLETVSGKFVDLVNPDPHDIVIEDISWSLSRLSRFNGHTIQVLPYSVGQHSIVVANETVNRLVALGMRLTSRETARMFLLGILHDASEAYTGDVSGPLKKIPEFRPVIKKLENNIQEAIYVALNIPPPTEEEEKIIKYGDLLAQKIEAYNFMPSRGMNWGSLNDLPITRLQEFEMPIPSLTVYQQFLDLYQEQYQVFSS